MVSHQRFSRTCVHAYQEVLTAAKHGYQRPSCKLETNWSWAMAQSGIRGISQSVIDNIVALQTAEDIADFNQQADNLRQLSDRLHESGDLGNTTVDLAAVRHFYASKFPLEQLARVATRGLALLAAHPCWSGGEAAAAGNRRTRTHATVQTPLSIYDDLFPLTSLMGVSLPLYVRCAEGPRAAEVAQLSLAQAMVSSGVHLITASQMLASQRRPNVTCMDAAHLIQP